MLQNLDRLKVFYHVYSEKSVMAAARTLSVSQSAVSQTLHKLEAEIKTLLFTRLHKRLVPTAAAQRLYQVVRPFMEALDICLKTLDQARDQPFGELRLGAPSEFGKTYFPELLADFQRQYRDVTFYLKLGDPGTLLPLLEEGGIDFALVDEFLTRNQVIGNLDIYSFEPVVAEEVILACSSHYYEMSVKGGHSFDRLIRQYFITYRHNGQTVKNWFKHHFDRYVDRFPVVLTVDSHQAVISAIKHHMGMGIVASHLVNEEIQNGSIIPINTSVSQIINQISLIQLQDKIPTLTEKVFYKFMLEKIQLTGI